MPHARINRANRRPQAGTAVGENQAESLAFQSAPIEIFQQRLPVRLTFARAAQKSQQMPAAIAADPIRHQHLHLLAPRRSPHPQTHSVQKEIDIVVTQPRLMKLAYRLIQIPRQLRYRLWAYRLPGDGRHYPTDLPRADAPQKRFADQQRNLFRPALKSPQPHRQKALAPGARNAQPNRPEPSHEISLVVAIAVIAPLPPAAARTAPSRKTGRVVVPTAARKTVATPGASAHTDRPRNSLSFRLENVGNAP